MRLCITGRSHVAALKNAIQEGLFNPSPHEITFLAASSSSYRTELRIENGVIRASGRARDMFLRTSDGQYDHLDPNKFDALVIYGTFYHIQMLFASIMRCTPQDSHLLSRAFLGKGVATWLSEQPTISTIKALRCHTQIPILLVFEPFFSERYKANLPPDARISPETRALVYEALNDVVRDAGAICLTQPDDTITDMVFSKDALSIGSKRLGGAEAPHDAEDFTHLNSQYGKIALDMIFGHLPAAAK